MLNVWAFLSSLALLAALAGCGDGSESSSQPGVDTSSGGVPDNRAEIITLSEREPSNPDPSAMAASESVNAPARRDLLMTRGISDRREAGPMPYHSGRQEQPDFTLASGLHEPGLVDDSVGTIATISPAAAAGDMARAQAAIPMAAAAAAVADPDLLLTRLRLKTTALANSIEQHARQIYTAPDGTLLDQNLTYTNQSISFSPLASSLFRSWLRIPLATGSKGRLLAYGFVSDTGLQGRGLVYGADVLAWMKDGSQEVQHRPLFKQAWTWAVSREAGLPTRLRVAVHGYPSDTVTGYLSAQLGVTGEKVTCNLLASTLAASCDGLDVLVIGGAITKDVTEYTRLVGHVKTLLAAGKTVMYFAPTTWNNYDPGTNALVEALGLAGGVPYGGNFFGCPGACVAVSKANLDELLTALHPYREMVKMLDLLAGVGDVPDIDASAWPIVQINNLQSNLASLQEKDISVFNSRSDHEMLRLMVSWADAWRQRVVYGAAVDKSVDKLAFLRAYASDMWIQNNRRSITAPPEGAGDYTPKIAIQGLKPSTAFEDIDVTIAQSSGVTLIGRAAVPAWPVEIEVVDAASSTALAVRNSHLRAWGSPMAFDAAKPTEVTYKSPVQPSAAPVPLKANERRYFITPFGGPLMLVYNGAKAGDVVKLRIRGAATYAHLDFTQPTPVSDEQIREMETRIQNDVLGWMTMKFVGGEVQQKISLARGVWMQYSRGSLNDYLRHGLTEDVFKVNHWANGYDNVSHTPTVARLCAELAWDCSSSVHRAPGVQHYVGWIAKCGFMCSGNPVDAFAGFGPGWGMAHELGHNTVQRVHQVTFSDVDVDTGAVVTKGCYTECDNNVLSVVTGLAEWSRHGVNIGAGRVGTRELYTAVLAPVRATIQDQGLDETQARRLMGTRYWTQGSDTTRWSLHFQLAALYGRYRHPDSPAVQKEMMYDFLRMLTMGDRLVARDWSTAKASRYAMGRYASNTIENHELIYVLSSRIIGRDLRRIFQMYGIPLSDTALGSVADLGLEIAPQAFYAFPDYAPELGSWLDLETGTPDYPYAS